MRMMFGHDTEVFGPGLRPRIHYSHQNMAFNALLNLDQLKP